MAESGRISIETHPIRCPRVPFTRAFETDGAERVAPCAAPLARSRLNHFSHPAGDTAHARCITVSPRAMRIYPLSLNGEDYFGMGNFESIEIRSNRAYVYLYEAPAVRDKHLMRNVLAVRQRSRSSIVSLSYVKRINARARYKSSDVYLSPDGI